MRISGWNSNRLTSRHRALGARLAMAIVLAVTAACATKDDPSPDATDSATVAAGGAVSTATPDSMRGHDMAGMTDSTHSMAGMTGNADQDFLRMMSDHHKGMIAMAQLATEDKRAATIVRADGRKLEAKQDTELKSMVTRLEQQFKDPYAPKIMPSNQAMLDGLSAKSGADFGRTFYQNVVKHHQEAIVMIEEFLPKMKDATIKALAERMKQDQSREIAEFQQKAISST
jgi:uncharacterized protein (DUF305 family)